MTNIGRRQAVDKLLGRNGLPVPTLFVHGMWDQEDIYGAPAAFAAVKASPNAYLVIGPWYHGQINFPSTSFGPIDLGGDTARWFRRNVLIPFLDQHLKGAAPARHRQGHRVPGRDQPVAAAARLAAGLRPLLPGGPDPALS